jgi:ATP-dependent DNA helicase RecG
MTKMPALISCVNLNGIMRESLDNTEIMDSQELANLLNDLESDRVERKASISDLKKIRQAICAFANDLPNYQQPGVIFVGVSDDGSCSNLEIDDRLLLTLASNNRSDGNILPFPLLTVRKEIINGCELAVVLVEPSDAPPVRFDGRTWIRVGPRRRARDLPFDLRPFPSSSIDDLDINVVRQDYLATAIAPEILAENHRTTVQQLNSLRFATTDFPPLPTTLGLLIAGKDPRRWIPGFYIQFVRFDGLDVTEPIRDQKEIGGSLIMMLREIDEILQLNISIASDLTAQPLEIRQPDYPIVALQELMRNAVMHRSYKKTNAPVRIYWFSDRVEIHSPGGAFGQVNSMNFGTGITDYRNPHLAEAMKNLGYVQRFGVGIPTAQKQLEENGNPPAKFTIYDSSILAIVKVRL